MTAMVGEIRIFAYDKIPVDWLRCDGKMLTVAENKGLAAVIGGRFGGDGIRNFALPDLTDRAIIGASTQFPFGTTTGSATVTLKASELPNHYHDLNAATISASRNFHTQFPAEDGYLSNRARQGFSLSFTVEEGFQTAFNSRLHPETITTVGGGKAHENRQPFLMMVYAICAIGDIKVRPLE